MFKVTPLGKRKHELERQLKALIWQRLAGMFLIYRLNRKLVNITKGSTLPRHLKNLRPVQQTVYGRSGKNKHLVWECEV